MSNGCTFSLPAIREFDGSKRSRTSRFLTSVLQAFSLPACYFKFFSMNMSRLMASRCSSTRPRSPTREPSRRTRTPYRYDRNEACQNQSRSARYISSSGLSRSLRCHGPLPRPKGRQGPRLFGQGRHRPGSHGTKPRFARRPDSVISPKSKLSKPLRKATATWPEPIFKAEAEYRDITSEGLLRASSFKGLSLK
ncbi:hypothetical protein SAMN05216337_10427 [Bradyrhizobium brasilense]|uniref:DNA ligase (ATP) n=1 Tax=Bradyrhizobium brasilense TaxID=1419277 RepID=A0A1G7HHQ6_9BRAD|nr:hypothetical protein SAMN05216337_10427 [Bradyrhizobium brasilense]